MSFPAPVMIEHYQTIVGIYQSRDPSAAFHALVSERTRAVPVSCACYVHASDREIRDVWPADADLSADLLDAALHVMRPEIFPLGSELPMDATRFHGAEMLLLPLHRNTDHAATCILIGDAGVFGEDLQPWQQLAAALEDFEKRHRRLHEAEERCDELHRRVEEGEALHTLGLAVNRTLDEGEVLNLVARFARTILGAQYVTVSTSHGGTIVTVASVGLRNTEAAVSDQHLARAVVEAEKPLVIGATEAELRVEDFPFHVEEGMKVGLGIPLSLFGETFGALVVGYRSDYEILPHDTRLALTLAGHAAVAISNAHLHEKVEQRSRDAEAAYEELNRMAEAKERFFASINHELRNPLGAVLGYQDLLLEGAGGELPPRATEFLAKAQRSAKTLRSLVNDLLDLSKIAAGKMDLEMCQSPLAVLIEQALDTIRPLAMEKGIAVIPPDATEQPPSVFTDAGRAQQILANLLSNAVKFTERGEVRVSVQPAGRPGDADDAFGWVEIRVIDTGAGIAPEHLELVFAEFEQVPGTVGGTGLGLPISRRLAQLLGGDLSVESEVGRGSAFILRLPCSATSSIPPGGMADSQTVPEIEQSPGPRTPAMTSGG